MATLDSSPMPMLHRPASQDAPPSPTLTNPDMILPYSVVGASPTPLASSPTLRAGDMGLSPGPSLTPTPEPELGVATAVKMPLRMKAGPPSSVIQTHTGYEHGAPLSDIGEEETTPRSKFSRRSHSPSPVEPSSPTPSGPKSKHKRTLSEDSGSEGSDIGDWENFDSSKMMSGRLAADVAKEDEEDTDVLESKRNSLVITPNVDGDDMAILNAKAEKILANARKRLTHMEDNLSKARHSVLWSPRSSPNMNELHQPAGGLYRSISLAGMGRKTKPLFLPVKSNLSHSRGLSDTTHTGGLKRLSMIPEARSSSAQEYGRRGESPQNQQSARFSPGSKYMAPSPASSRSVHSPMRTLEEEEGSPTSTIKTSPENPGPRGLGINTLANQTKENVSEIRRSPSPTLDRSTSVASTRSLRSQMSDLQIRIADLKAKAQEDKQRRQSVQSRNTPSPFNQSSNPEHWYTSAPEYKQGGSPLNTNAGIGWSPVHEKKESIDAHLTPVTPKAASFLDLEPPETGETAFKSDARTDVNTPSLAKRTVNVEPLVDDRVDSVIDDSYYEDAAQQFEDDDGVAASEEEQVYLNEVLEESLQDVQPEVPDIPDQFLEGEVEAERHEDRIDAFDYENMFLHSALGNYAGGGARSRSNSDSSETSVETRRADQQTPTAAHREEVQSDEEEGPEDSDDEGETLIIQNDIQDDSDALPTPRGLAPPTHPWLKHTGRSQSVDSVSTVATFATATEGGDHDDHDDDEPHEILHWGNDTGFPQPPLASPRREMAGAFPTPPLSGRMEQQPSLRLVTGNAFSNGMPTPTQSPMPMSASTKSAGTTPRSLTQAPEIHRLSIGTQRSGTSEGHPGNTEILMESLIKLADPDFKVSGDGNVFADVDKDLVLSLLRAVGGVCNGVLTANGSGEVREVKVLRRRLDEARRVLEGEDGEEE